MKKIYLIIIVIISFKTASAQKEYNTWYFGDNAGIDFNSGAPYAITNSAMNTSEGCSSISDANGNILFYTDGSTIWNRNNVPMPNGTGLTGNISSTQSGLIVKQPGNSNLYYVFTTFATLNYSIVDMNLDGGLGDVTASKNIFVINGSEKLCATRNSNGIDVWIVMHESNTNGFNAYPLTSTGISLTPVHSNDGIANDGGPGQMKISVDGSHIAFGGYAAPNTIYLGNFNNTTGIVSAGFSIPTSYPQTYGLEFSPDGSKLYGGANQSVYKVYQFDLNAGTPAAIIASSTAIGSTVAYEPAALQLGPDKKIYISPAGSDYLDVINVPDSTGIACNFVHNAIYLGGMECELGLPSCVYDNVAVIPPVAAFQSSDTILCTGDCISFTDLSIHATSWQWSFAGGEPATSTDQNPPYVCYTTAGLYNVKLIASDPGGSDSVTYTNYINVKDAPPTPDIKLVGTTLYCSTDSSYTSYHWYDSTTIIPGATDTFLVITNSGNYNVQVANANGCKIAVGINVVLDIQNYSSGNFIFLFPNPATDQLTIHTSSLHANESVTVSIMNVIGQDVSTAFNVRWSLNEAEVDVSKLEAGIYFLKLKTDSGSVVKRFVKE